MLSKYINCKSVLSFILLLGMTQAKQNKVITTYNEEEILSETQWKHLEIKKKAPVHLSMISQGKFDSELINSYDTNYYYPSSAGKDIDIYFLDYNFNLNSDSFPEEDDRIVRCELFIKNGTIIENHDEKSCFNPSIFEHGTYTTYTAASKNYGVAPKANVYAFHMDSLEDFDEIFLDATVALKYIKEHLFRPHKTVINLSFGTYIKKEEFNKGVYKEFKDLVNEFTEMGAVVVTSAHNLGRKIDEGEIAEFPCSLDNTICVGGVNNDHEGKVFTNSSYVRSNESCYGEEVDIYAPYNINFINKEFYNYSQFTLLVKDYIEGMLNDSLKNICGYETEDDTYHGESKILGMLFDGQTIKDKRSLRQRLMKENDQQENQDMFKMLCNIFSQDLNRETSNLLLTYLGDSIKSQIKSYSIEEDGIYLHYDYPIGGTSFSGPIVSGVAASIMSEFPEIKFNTCSMLEYLNKIGIKGIIQNIPEGPNVFINNGKHTVYSGETSESIEKKE